MEKIIRCTKPVEMLFNDLSYGDIFSFEDEMYIVTGEACSNDIWAMSLKYGDINDKITYNTKVILYSRVTFEDN